MESFRPTTPTARGAALTLEGSAMSVTIDRRPLGDGPTMHDLPTQSRIDRSDAGGETTAPAWHRLAGDAGDRVLGSTRALLIAFVVFTALAVVSLLLLTGRTDTAFAWTIRSRPNATFLGAAYAAGLVLSVLALSRRRWSDVRVTVLTVTVFTVLTLVPTLLHLHKFHFMAEAGAARLAAGVWLVVYLVVPIAGAVVLARQGRQERRGRPAPDQRERVVARPMPAALVALLVAQGTALGAAGTVLFAGGATLHQPMDMERPGWAWPVMPLTSQALGAWLLAFAVAIIVVIRERDLSRMFVPALAYVAFGAFELAVLLAYRTAPNTHTGWWLAGALVFASFVPTGVYGAWAARRGSVSG
jgi:hypothetical protein